MKLRTKTCIYLALVAGGILANYFLMRYRRHLYDLNSDYELEPLQTIQHVLFEGTLVFIAGGALLLSWAKFFGKK